ncbi:unnamed protein product [Bursaphelenchus xylophilus]|uniref:(pine wood nematode) hypothetical protein n=1 Tax=Bursaphelenchus xylophilus TaxID=6326 RepID=A0A1I7RR97_BURXY|nr:unnamed protein product [Bursaphelenchus xylophilus]CAG9130885.1 unnamed protein product [Bursaphelenchus xylophilus]
MLDLIDCGADDWRVVCTWRRISRFVVEFILCSLCPYPGTGTVEWWFVEPSRTCNHTFEVKEVPVDLLLSLFMLGRVYLAGRFVVLHSKQFQDASTRTLAALNRIQVNFTFVMKSWLDQHPMRCLSLFLLMFWFTFAWTFVQCERLGREDETKWLMYSNALWFIASTFNGNGYGDVVPKTTAGRLVGIFVGLTGAIISSILIAVISRKIVLSSGQRNVNNFMNDSRLTVEHKNAAARVLQKTWHIYKNLHSNDTGDRLLRRHQREFLNAIHSFRKVKNKIRNFNESNDVSSQQATRLMLEMHTNMLKLVNTQEEMRTQMEVMQRAIRNHFTHQHAVTIAETKRISSED